MPVPSHAMAKCIPGDMTKTGIQPGPEVVGDYRRMLEMMPGIVYTASVDEPGRMLYVNRRAEVMLGFSTEEWVGDPALWARQIHPEDRDRVLAAHEGARAERISLACEYRMLTRGGRVLWVQDQCVPVLDDQGRLKWMQGLLLDITERRHAEAEVREWHGEMERMLGLQVAAQTAAAIAHELNQPLNAIASYNAAALRLLRAGNPRPDRLQHALEQGADQVQRAGRVMRDLLALLHKGETMTEGVYLNAAAREAISILVADGYIDGVRAEMDFMEDLPRVKANRLQVQKVLINLLRNGVEAIHGVGRTTGLLKVRTSMDDSMARVCVEDDGPGLDAEALSKIFEPFFTTKAEGIGMGLAISRALINAHGGRLWVEQPRQGCRFCFTLPLAE